MKASEVLEKLKVRFPNEPEYIQAVSQILGTIEESITSTPSLRRRTLLNDFVFPTDS